MRSLLLGVAALALASGAFALLIPDAAGQGTKAPPQRATPATSFREDVFPIFKGRCVECHQPGGQGYETSGLDLTTAIAATEPDPQANVFEYLELPESLAREIELGPSLLGPLLFDLRLLPLETAVAGVLGHW